MSAPHTLQYIGDQVAKSPPCGGLECGPVRGPPQPASIDMGLLIGNGVSPDATDDTGDAPHRPIVYVTDVPRDDSVAPE